jgi:hypothetical protein
MSPRVYVLSNITYGNILGIFTNIRQCRKYITILKSNPDFENYLMLHEIRLNEPEKVKINMTKLLVTTQ